MRVFITGIRGFIPSHLANYLFRKGHRVFGIDNVIHPSKNPLDKGIHSFYGDVRYYEDIDKYVERADIVYHMAAQINVDKSITYPQETMAINLDGTVNMLNACRRHKKTMVFSSTSEIYGGHDEIISENSPTYAQSPYAVSKLAADKLCGNYHNLYGLRVFRFRGFNTFGPYQGNDQYGAVIPIFVRNVLNGKPPVIFGDGTQSRDYIHIDDVVRAYEILPTIDELNGEPVNIGTGKAHSIYNIAKHILKYCNRTDLKPKHVAPRLGEVHCLRADISLFLRKSRLKFPTVRFYDGLEQYIDWYAKSINRS